MDAAADNFIKKAQARTASLEKQIAQIQAEAEKQSAPLKAELSRIKIAAEVYSEFNGDAGEAEDDADIAPIKPSTKNLILRELEEPGIPPLTKMEFVSRFTAQGHLVNEATVGSTLSNMLRDGLLTKDKMNRYATSKA